MKVCGWCGTYPAQVVVADGVYRCAADVPVVSYAVRPARLPPSVLTPAPKWTGQTPLIVPVLQGGRWLTSSCRPVSTRTLVRKVREVRVDGAVAWMVLV